MHTNKRTCGLHSNHPSMNNHDPSDKPLPLWWTTTPLSAFGGWRGDTQQHTERTQEHHKLACATYLFLSGFVHLHGLLHGRGRGRGRNRGISRFHRVGLLQSWFTWSWYNTTVVSLGKVHIQENKVKKKSKSCAAYLSPFPLVLVVPAIFVR